MATVEAAVAWRTLRPYYTHELEPGRAPEIPFKPWLDPAQMELAKKVQANEKSRRIQLGSRLKLKGRRFGRLIALHTSGTRARSILWLCRCDCGQRKLVAATNLQTGDTRSCGCLKRESARRIADLIRPKAMAAIRAKRERAEAARQEVA